MYSDPNLQPNMNMGYDYRSSSMHYKPPDNLNSMNNMSNINPSFHQHQIYYENQPILAPPMESNSYMPMVGVQNMEPGYDLPRYYWGQMEPKPDNFAMLPSSQGASQSYSQPPQQQQNVVQRIAGLIKSQLPALQAIMVHVSSIYNQPPARLLESRRQHSRSRSRSKQRYRKGSDSSHDWLCRKCSFSNYDWRESCKRCYQARPSRNFVPGPQDWKCPKCGNINYARRMECNRCKRPKNGND